MDTPKLQRPFAVLSPMARFFMPLRFRHLLHSVRSRVAVFALLATLLPSITLGWLSYDRNASVLRQKAEHEIVSAGQFAAREIDLWLKDRVHEARVIGSSHLITENLERYVLLGKRAASGVPRSAIALSMLEYLRSVGKRFPGYAVLQINSLDGELLVSDRGAQKIPEEWLRRLRQNEVVIGEPGWNEATRSVTLPVIIPIRSARGQPLGSLLAVVETAAVEKILSRLPLAEGDMYIANSKGWRVPFGGPSAEASELPGFALLSAASGRPGEYANAKGQAMVGSWQKIPDAEWGIVVERASSAVFSQVYALRNTTVLLVAALLVVVGVGAYGIGLTLVYPLDRLVGAADKVASGNLDVTLPIARRDELGQLTERFNEMTAQLRKNREELATANEALVRKNVELEALAVTDALTGLSNRRFLMDVLEREFKQHARTGRTFTLLMADLDYFKRVNDTYGHPAGDAVLVNAASLFKGEIRSVDYAARFGGEEFTLLLMDSGMEDARVIAERIRQRFIEKVVHFDGKDIPVTVSIGLAQVADDQHDTVTALIARADAALYAAKHGGRNRVVCDEGKVRHLPPRAVR